MSSIVSRGAGDAAYPSQVTFVICCGGEGVTNLFNGSLNLQPKASAVTVNILPACARLLITMKVVEYIGKGNY